VNGRSRKRESLRPANQSTGWGWTLLALVVVGERLVAPAESCGHVRVLRVSSLGGWDDHGVRGGVALS